MLGRSDRQPVPVPRPRWIHTVALAAAFLGLGPGRAAGGIPGATTPGPQPARIFQYSDPGQFPAAVRADVFTEYVTAYRAAFASGNFTHAAELATRAAMLLPKLRRPWNHLAAARLKLAEWGPAIEAARTADQAADDSYAPLATDDETRAGAAYWEGVALYSTQRFEAALARLHAASERAPRWAEAARALAECSFVAGKSRDAALAYTTAFDLDPALGTVQDLSYFAEARAAGGDVDGAVGVLQAALRRAPYEPGLHAKLGDLLRREGAIADAYYELIHEVMLQGVESSFAPAVVAMQDTLVKEAQKAPKVPGAHEILLVASALANIERGEEHKALHQVQAAFASSHTTSPVLLFLFADALFRNGVNEKSLNTASAIIAAHPDFIPAYWLRADIQTKLGRSRDAAATHTQLEQAFPGYWRLRTRVEQH
jgi:tetratricopeptide (TPR) repeat protein